MSFRLQDRNVMKANKFIVASVFLMSSISFAQAQGRDYEKQRTLAEMITLRREIVFHKHPVFARSDADKFALNNSAVTSQVKLIYRGKKRPIPPLELRLLDGMSRTYALNPNSMREFVEEVLFTEGDDDYWIPTKRDTIAILEGTLKTGDGVMVFVDLVGAYRIDKRWEWIFTVNRIV